MQAPVFCTGLREMTQHLCSGAPSGEEMSPAQVSKGAARVHGRAAGPAGQGRTGDRVERCDGESVIMGMDHALSDYCVLILSESALGFLVLLKVATTL